MVPNIFIDQRGYFFESYQSKEFINSGLDYFFVQDNEAYSNFGTVRGLHYQIGKYAQAKLVRVVEGEVLDVVVDLRKSSPMFGRYFSIVLSGENKKQLLIPRGFAHGYSVLSNTAIFSYKCDNYYQKSAEAGIHPLDPGLQIDWKVPTDKIILSEKDQTWPFLK